MESKIYIISKIEGEYARLLAEEDGGGELFVALALLPPLSDLGDRLRYEGLSFLPA